MKLRLIPLLTLCLIQASAYAVTLTQGDWGSIRSTETVTLNTDVAGDRCFVALTAVDAFESILCITHHKSDALLPDDARVTCVPIAITTNLLAPLSPGAPFTPARGGRSSFRNSTTVSFGPLASFPLLDWEWTMQATHVAGAPLDSHRSPLEFKYDARCALTEGGSRCKGRRLGCGAARLFRWGAPQ